MTRIQDVVQQVPVDQILRDLSEWQFSGADDLPALHDVMAQRLGEAAVYSLAGPRYQEYGTVYHSPAGVALVQLGRLVNGGDPAYDWLDFGVIVATDEQVEQLALSGAPHAMPTQRAGMLAVHHADQCGYMDSIGGQLTHGRLSGPYAVLKYPLEEGRLPEFTELAIDILTDGEPNLELTRAFISEAALGFRHPRVRSISRPAA